MRWCNSAGHYAALAGFLFLIAAGATIAQAQGTPAGTVIPNSATLNFTDDAGQAQPAVTSNTVNVTVSQVAAVAVAPATGASGGQPGQVTYYAVTVTNKGNGSDSFALSATSASSPAWTVAIYKDDGAGGGVANDGVHQAGETNIASSTGTLAADATFKCFVAVAVPADAADGATDSTTFTAASAFDATKRATAAFTTTVTAVQMTLTKTADKSQAAPGEIIRYTVTYSNSGAVNAANVVVTDTLPSEVTYVADSVRVNGAPRTDAADGDGVTVASGVITVNLGPVGPGAEGTITFDVKVD